MQARIAENLQFIESELFGDLKNKLKNAYAQLKLVELELQWEKQNNSSFPEIKTDSSFQLPNKKQRNISYIRFSMDKSIEINKDNITEQRIKQQGDEVTLEIDKKTKSSLHDQSIGSAGSGTDSVPPVPTGNMICKTTI